jgi:hypothetical protein
MQAPNYFSQASSLQQIDPNDQEAMIQAASDLQLNRSLLARDFLASTQTQPSSSTMFQMLQMSQPHHAYGNVGNMGHMGSHLSGFHNPPTNTADLNSLLSGLANQSAADQFYLQQALNSATNQFNPQFMSFAPAQAPGPGNLPLTLPSSTLSTLSARIPLLHTQGQGNSRELEEAMMAQLNNAGTQLSTVQGDHEQVTHPGVHPPVVVYMECDEESLSDYQCLLRKQIELFEAYVHNIIAVEISSLFLRCSLDFLFLFIELRTMCSGTLKGETRLLSWDKLVFDVAIVLVFQLGLVLVEPFITRQLWMVSIKPHKTWPRITFADTAG